MYYTKGLPPRGAAGSGAGASAGGSPARGSSAGGAAPAPILFLHGVGGLVIYLELIWQIVRLRGPVIVVDIRHMGMRLRCAPWA